MNVTTKINYSGAFRSPSKSSTNVQHMVYQYVQYLVCIMLIIHDRNSFLLVFPSFLCYLPYYHAAANLFESRRLYFSWEQPFGLDAYKKFVSFHLFFNTFMFYFFEANTGYYPASVCPDIIYAILREWRHLQWFSSLSMQTLSPVYLDHN